MILNIQINREGLQFFNTYKQKIVIIRPYIGDETYKIACLSIRPIPMLNNTNTVKFLDEWHEYATIQSLEEKKRIVMQDERNVDIGSTYIFNDSGFEGVIANGQRGYFGFTNQQTGLPVITCGMAQSIIVNQGDKGLYMVCAESVPINQSTFFEPSSKLWILAAKGITPNMVVPSNMLRSSSRTGRGITTGNFLEVDLEDTNTIYFENSTNLFKKGKLPQ